MMNCPALTVDCPENPDKTTRTDTRARIRNRTLSGVRFSSGFATPVSGLSHAQKISNAVQLLTTDCFTPWQRAFVVGCHKRVASGLDLSPKQAKVIEALLDIAVDAEGAT
jgi:hypothetical protein